MIIIDFLIAVFRVYILHPIQRWWRFHINHTYIPDNPRNQEIFDYLMKVANNPDYEPSTPTEHFFERQVEEDYRSEYPDDDWHKARQAIFLDLADEMLQYEWVDERSLEDDE